ncbi:MAG TPA: penicillin-binding protein 1C [Gammaproteobacteria bacterium]|nr:penicillin-binding protein 1C [Gammaproteobacteria bacterium]
MKWSVLVVVVSVLLLSVFKVLDTRYPLVLDKLQQRSVLVNDRNGRLLRAFATPDGHWRLPVRIEGVDPRFITMLLAYEDQRFYQHFGVDLLALLRATGQLLSAGHIISGASTLTMQLARLLREPQRRSLTAKLVQIFRAIQLEQYFSKAQILQAYLLLAPYGGNLEGIRAASLAYFGKEPRHLTVAEAALLVALPQSPEKRRPDRHQGRALAARNRVLTRMVAQKVLAEEDALFARHSRVPTMRQALPALAAHVAEAVHRRDATRVVHTLTIDRQVQQQCEQIAREQVTGFAKGVSLAMLVVDYRSGEIVADVGSPNFFNQLRFGEIDMTRARRSPGSTLKPLIYGMAFEQGVVHPASLIDDMPSSFSGYRPRNFDLAYQGTVTVSDALQRSLNVPAIKLLNAVGPQSLLNRLQRVGIMPLLPAGKSVGLAIGLGGLGLSLRDLSQLYTAIARGGEAIALRERLEQLESYNPQRLLLPVANWYVQDILTGVPRPAAEAQTGSIAWKTGTSYGFRDAWAIGFDGRYVVAVWVGRPDGAPVPEITGLGAAAPVLFAAFQRIGSEPLLLRTPSGLQKLTTKELPATLVHFVPRGQLLRTNHTTPPPVIVFPPTGARIDLGWRHGKPDIPLFLKLQGGKPPFRWLANGQPFAALSRRRQITWLPDSIGFSSLTVLDAVGHSARIRVFLE